MPLDLTPERGLLFRITHVANLPWILIHGIHAALGALADPNFVSIGNSDLIDKRRRRPVPIPPAGMLSDYVPFYLTPKSPMLLNIRTGYNGVTQRPNDEIVVLVSSCQQMATCGVALLFTDRHAYTDTAVWTADAANLGGMIDWDILCRHDFARNDEYPDKMDRYQAEALAHQHVPSAALLGIACASPAAKLTVETAVRQNQANVQTLVRPNWYF